MLSANLRLRQISELQQRDPFIERYMNWLGHHEFGNGHKHYDFGNKRENDHDTRSIEYWLDNWLKTYSYLLDSCNELNRHMIFICYERLCDNSQNIWESLLERLGIENIQKQPEFRLGKTTTLNGIDHSQLVAAENVYNNLCSLC